jgi:hypothetical protein
MVQSQEQLCIQTEGIQVVDAPNNESQQLVTTSLPLH